MKNKKAAKITFLTDVRIEDLIIEDVDNGDFNATKTSLINKILFDHYKLQNRIK